MDDKNQAQAKRPYRTPRLVRLGTLTQVTANVSSTNPTQIDNPHSGHKTA